MCQALLTNIDVCYLYPIPLTVVQCSGKMFQILEVLVELFFFVFVKKYQP